MEQLNGIELGNPTNEFSFIRPARWRHRRWHCKSRGGLAYLLQVKKRQTVDAEFLNEEHRTTFINYLRICFDNSGFSRITNPEYDNDYQTFFDMVNRNSNQYNGGLNRFGLKNIIRKIITLKIL